MLRCSTEKLLLFHQCHSKLHTMYTTASKRNLALTKSTGQKVHSLNTLNSINSTNMQLQTCNYKHAITNSQQQAYTH